MAADRPVLRPGDTVHFDGEEHQVVGLAGTSVRLRSGTGAEQMILAGYLMASPGFAVVDGEPMPAVEPFGLLDAVADEALSAAKQWERHLVVPHHDLETVLRLRRWFERGGCPGVAAAGR
jgi:hypothetical protein